MVVLLCTNNSFLMEHTVKIFEYKSKYGELLLGDFDGKLCLCDWKYRKQRDQIDSRIQKELKTTYELQLTPLLKETISQLEDYFSRKRTVFELPLLLVGSDFQKKVWNALLEIPFGKTSTYLKQSITLQNKEAIRAVATANGANAISILVPCHRIIGSDGDLVGYAGGITAKQKLLELEGVQLKNHNQIKIDF
jgi:methylated-DNA-[protein]-cysteine S-methyltransferase